MPKIKNIGNFTEKKELPKFSYKKNSFQCETSKKEEETLGTIPCYF
jgi:hypothetical protein